MRITKLGFIGTGFITEAVITGLAKLADKVPEVWVSPRNAAVAARLAERYAFVHVASDNQDVLDRCDVVCLAVLPQHAGDILPALAFRPAHHVLSFIAATNIARLAELVPGAAKRVRIVPLPMVANLNGPTAIYPADDIAQELFAALGQAVSVKDEVAFDAVCAATALMAGFYANLETYAQWMAGKGVAYDDARSYLAVFFRGLGDIACASNQGFAELAQDVSTEGGLNEQVAKDLLAAGLPEISGRAIERVFQRIRGA